MSRVYAPRLAPIDRAHFAERALRAWSNLFDDVPVPGRRRRLKPIKERLCRAGCGRLFKLVFPASADAVSQQTCDECFPLMIAAMEAALPYPERSIQPSPPGTARLADIKMIHMLTRLRKHREEFIAAWRLGAGRVALRKILEAA